MLYYQLGTTMSSRKFRSGKKEQWCEGQKKQDPAQPSEECRLVEILPQEK